MRPLAWIPSLMILAGLGAQDAPERLAEDEKPPLKSAEDPIRGRLTEIPKIVIADLPAGSYAGETRPCSIPLTPITPLAGGSMPVLPGPVAPGPVRIVEPPAPPCDSQSTFQRLPAEAINPFSATVKPKPRHP